MDFYFDNLQSVSSVYTKTLDIFQVQNSVSPSSSQPYIYSYFHIIGKATSNLTFDLEFSLNDFNTTKYCTIKGISFLGEVYVCNNLI